MKASHSAALKGNEILKIVHALENASSISSQSKWEISWPGAILPVHVGMGVNLKNIPDDIVHVTASGEERFLMLQSCDILNWSRA